ncbi:hypothetical protein JHS3_11140 [Jeongeupia sp. HS-3]|nr:hypothetical protein JHS3_11140 [Jeongeupia sp. HS-3]
MGFFDADQRADYEVAGTWPDDAVEISDALYRSLMAPRDDGKVMDVSPDGMPALVDPPPPAPVPVDALRQLARDAINQWRDRQEQGVIQFEHAGHRWDGGLKVRDRLNTTLGTLKAYGVPDDFFWTSADNIDVPMTHLELQALYEAHERAVFYQGWQIHQRQRELKRQVDAADAVWLQTFVPNWPMD